MFDQVLKQLWRGFCVELVTWIANTGNIGQHVIDSWNFWDLAFRDPYQFYSVQRPSALSKNSTS